MNKPDFQYIMAMVKNGGPEPDEYDELNSWFVSAWKLLQSGRVTAEELQRFWNKAGEPFSAKTIQGMARVQPHNYAGDYEIIDMIYRRLGSVDEHLFRWDHFFHWQKAARAVRNRKTYFIDQLQQFEQELPGSDRLKVLNIGSGPGRDLLEFFTQNRETRVSFHCLDSDSNAIRYAQSLCHEHLERIVFKKVNALRFRPAEKYHFIWSAGLFDYFDDRTFIFLLRRLMAMLLPEGRLVIGNFSIDNPSRPYMECGNWFLNCRHANHLVSLARSCDVPHENIRVAKEPEGVNLFLHIKG